MAIYFSSVLYLTVAIFFGTNAYAIPVSSISYSADKETVIYSNGSSVIFSATSTKATWGKDHTTKTITYLFADKTKNLVVSSISAAAGAPTYIANVQTIVTRYGDGVVKSTVTNRATASQVTWGTDHRTKTTSYIFLDGTQNTVITFVSPMVGAPTYSLDVQSIVTTYGDGTVKSTATTNATSTQVTWGKDHMTKTTTYRFLNGHSTPWSVRWQELF